MNSLLRPKLNTQKEIIYPESDGEPLGETDLHALETVCLFDVLRGFFRRDPMVYVAMDNFLYYKEGDPKAVISPDVYVVKGAPKVPPRRTYRVWDEGGRVPSIVFELTSKSSKVLDLGKKKMTCAKLGVREYFLFDPYCEYLNPSLRGFRLIGNDYTAIAPDADGNVFSDELQLTFSAKTPGQLRVINPKTGNVLHRYEEIDDLYEHKSMALERTEAILEEKESALERTEAVLEEKDAALGEAKAHLSAAEAEIARLKEELNKFKQKKK